jgi:hypothetical protein
LHAACVPLLLLRTRDATYKFLRDGSSNMAAGIVPINWLLRISLPQSKHQQRIRLQQMHCCRTPHSIDVQVCQGAEVDNRGRYRSAEMIVFKLSTQPRTPNGAMLGEGARRACAAQTTITYKVLKAVAFPIDSGIVPLKRLCKR